MTCGEGGAVITNNLEYFERVQTYISRGPKCIAWATTSA
jgi:dTDP-4-amino-4,6-dideoxygalactose transaminase